jgi:hypothetical protein
MTVTADHDRNEHPMNKIKLIIWREFITRVRKPSFLIMTILAPVLMAAGITGGIHRFAGQQCIRCTGDGPGAVTQGG